MNIITKYIFAAAAALLMAAGIVSCAKDELAGLKPEASYGDATFNDDGTMNITVNVEIPDMNAVQSRAMSGTPDYDNLSLFLLVFEEGEGLKQYAKLASESGHSDASHGHNELVTFRAVLEPTEKNAVIHLIATDQPDFEYNIVYGTEERVITSLYTDDDHEAYWQRRDPGSNIPSKEDAEKDKDGAKAKIQRITALLSHVPMVRNFCRVSIITSDKVKEEGKFTLTGLYVLNTADRGSVAPYVSGNPVGERFVEYFNEADGHYEGKSYGEISAQNHIGTPPTGVQVINKENHEDDLYYAKSEGEGDLEPAYFYERPARTTSTERTYVIIRGRFRESNKTVTSYYKIDLGYVAPDDMIGRFEYYNLLRNFDYCIRLNSVDSSGYRSLEEAKNGAVSNNFSASVEARSMTNISDGEDIIFVSFTTFVFTQPNQVKELLAQYRENIDEGQGGEVDNTLLKVKWEAGDVITDVKESINTGKSFNDWNTYTVTGGEPTDKLRQQSLYIYRGNKAADGEPAEYGLYREVIFFSHIPWSFVHIDTYPGLWSAFENLPDGEEWDWGNEPREVGSQAGAGLTLFFELPPGLPKAIFPLDFVIESDRQNIQNAHIGNAVVKSVPATESLFYENPTLTLPSTARIQYVKTVTWDEYFEGEEDDEISTGSAIIRCRFLTITDLDQDGVGKEENGESRSTTTLRVYNPYFGQYDEKTETWTMYHEDKFKRDTSGGGGYDEKEDYFEEKNLVWDFSESKWESFLSNLNNGNRDLYTESNNPGNPDIADERLRFIDEGYYYGIPFWGGRYYSTIKSDTYNGYRYVRLTYSSDKLKYKHTFNDDRLGRTMRVIVMCTNANNRATAPKVVISNVKGGNGTVTSPNTKATEIDDKTKPYQSYIFDINVPTNVESLDVDIMRPNNNRNEELRVYRVEFYSTWSKY